MRNIKEIFLLNIVILVFSFSGVLTKLAARETMLSIRFVLYYGIALFLMGLYAVVWQQILRRLQLTTAYANRAVSLVWSMIWGILFFKEHIRWTMVLGMVVIIAGIYMVVTSDG